MTKKFNQYLGKAGHLAVMSEFLMLGWNVAIPEVDVGDDIFVVQDEQGTLRKVQVKTSAATQRKSGLSGQFSVSAKNLRNISNILVHYVFILRYNNKWLEPVIIRQDFLLDLYQNNHIGSNNGNKIVFYFSYGHGEIKCSGRNLNKFVRDFTDFPFTNH